MSEPRCEWPGCARAAVLALTVTDLTSTEPTSYSRLCGQHAVARVRRAVTEADPRAREEQERHRRERPPVERFCACGRRRSECDGSRTACPMAEAEGSTP